MFTDPQEQTGSDTETPIAARYHRWRMYHRILPDGTIQWCAYQPDNVDVPFFPAPKGDRYAMALGGLYGAHSSDGQHVLEQLDQALRNAKAAA